MAKNNSKPIPPSTQQKHIANQRFGRLVAIEYMGQERLSSGGLKYLWRCLCDCGRESIVKAGNLRSGHSTSCGCKQRESAADHCRNMASHGMTGTRLYSIWRMMKDRCFNPNGTSYPNYGARGITVCDSWRDSFKKFASDMGEPPSDDHTLDRIDNNGNYTPDNCRWATPREQANKKRNTLYATHNGVTKTVAQWAREKGMNYQTLYVRLKYGWSIERALTEPVQRS